MPIRFRCAYCNQLMGIARRKAGSVVQCPSCAGQVIVPDPEPERKRKAHKGASKPAPNEVFERGDIDKLFNQGPLVYPPPQPARSNGSQAPNPDAVMHPVVPASGLVLTPGRMTLLAVGIIILLGLAFFLGLLVGGGQ
jgi:hypothetical protein